MQRGFAHLLLRPSRRQQLVELGGPDGWRIPRSTAEAPGVVYSAGAGDDPAFERALLERGHRVVLLDPTPQQVERLGGFAASGRLELATEPGAGRAGLAELLRRADALPRRWVDVLRVPVADGEHAELRTLLRRGPKVAVLCVELAPPASPRRIAGTVVRWRAAGYALACADGPRYTFAPRSSYVQALRRRLRRVAGRLRREPPPAPVVRGNPAARRPAVALTFDDGPSEWTGPILDTLAAAGAHATFFVVGEAIAGREDLLRRMRAEGHEIGNHSFRHPRLADLDRSSVRDELARTTAAVAGVVGAPPRLFRPPYFADSDEVRRIAGALGLGSTVYAPVWTHDWAMESGEAICEAILAAVYPGAIVLLHDGRPLREPLEGEGASRPDRLPTVAAVALLVPALLERGFALVTVSELLAL